MSVCGWKRNSRKEGWPYFDIASVCVFFSPALKQNLHLFSNVWACQLIGIMNS